MLWGLMFPGITVWGLLKSRTFDIIIDMGYFQIFWGYLRISNYETVIYYKKKRFQREKRFFVELNDLLQAIKCPFDYQMHQLSPFFYSNITKHYDYYKH